MKKIACFFVLTMVILIISGCSERSINDSSNVELCNLDSYVIENSVFELSKDELQSVVAAKFSAIDIEIDPKSLTDEDVAALGFISVSEFKASIIRDIVSHRLTEEYYNYLLENSNVTTNESTNHFISAIISKTTSIASQHGKTIEEFIEEKYQMRSDEFKNYLSDLWANMQIIFAFCDDNNLICSKEEIEDAKNMLTDSEEFQCYAANEEIEVNIIRYFILDEKLKDKIAILFNSEIEQYTADVISSISDFKKWFSENFRNKNIIFHISVDFHWKRCDNDCIITWR